MRYPARIWMDCLLVGLCLGAQTAPVVPKPGPKDLCPVCGMLVSKYPNWVASVVYKGGHVQHFDGAKDFFKGLLDPAKYASGRKSGDILAMVVTEFYGLKKIDAKTAWYVLGSDVLGPMGHELIPLATQPDAEEFRKDHKGTRIVRFDQVTRELLVALDR